jgi:hypothetical protein
MNYLEKTEKEILALNSGQSWDDFFQDGGPEVIRANDKFLLFEIPQYGGKPQYYGTFDITEIKKLIGTIST